MRKINKLSVFVIVYAILISAWFASWLVVGDSNWWLTLLNRIVPYLFIPIPLFPILIIRSRQLKLIIVLLLPLLIFGSLYHPYLFPKPGQVRERKSELNVMTYNVLFSNQDYERVANVILTYHPDLVALQEVQPEMMSALIERLAGEYPYFLMETENSYGTTAVFSRYAFSESSVLDLDADRPAVVVKTKINSQEITFVAIHLLAYNLWWTKLKDIPATVMERTVNQNRQASIVLNQIADEEGIIIVGCDCNSYETSGSYRIFDQVVDNSAWNVGWLLWGDNLPGSKQDLSLQHIDYVWYKDGITPTGVYKITDDGGSDHLPVLAIFEIN